MKIKYFWILITMILIAGCTGKASSPATTENPTGPGVVASATAPAPVGTDTQTPAPATSTPVPPSPTTVAPTATVIAPAATQEATSTSSPQEPTSPAATETQAVSPTSQTTGAATATVTPVTTTVEAASGCTDVAAFYKDVTVEDYTFFKQSESFVKTWEVRNEGTCTWGTGYTVFFDSGFTFDAPDSSPLPAAAPGQVVDISLDMTAPNRGGQYMSRWRFKDADGNIFGVGLENGQLYTVINVGFINPTSQPSQPASQPSSGGTQPTPVPGSTGSGCNYSLDLSFSQQVVAIINQARQQAGLNTLNVQSQLTAAAQEHSIDIACHDSYDHIGSDGSLWTDRVSRQGYANFTSARENIRVGDPAFGFSPQYVFDRWFESQIHHDNMYYPTVSDIGVSCVLNPDTEYKEFCTAVFARP